MILGVLRALHETGRSVPAEVSVVGFDDMPDSGYFLPPLTTVRQDFAELGRRGEALVRLGEEGASLVVTVDCGAQAFEALAMAREAGVDVIVVDHHKCSSALPLALALVNPNRLDEEEVGAGVEHITTAVELVGQTPDDLRLATVRQRRLGTIDLAVIQHDDRDIVGNRHRTRLEGATIDE